MTNTQVARTLAALGADAPDAPVPDRPRRDARCRSDAVPPGVLERLDALPSLRRDRTDWARDLVSSQRLPSDGDLAEKLVGRLVVDRLR